MDTTTGTVGKYILDDKGNPVACFDLVKWAEWFEASQKNGARAVAKTSIGDITISTIFLAIDHSFVDKEGLPLLYETMVFGGNRDGDQERSATKGQALQDHIDMIKLVLWDKE